MGSASNRKVVLSWALYDWGNSAFATTVMAGFFPLFFKQYWSAGASSQDSTFQLGLSNSLASVLVAFAAPVLGVLADRSRRKKRFLLLFTVLGVLATGGLVLVDKGDYFNAALLYVLGSVGFFAGIVFYDALLVGVAEESQRDRISALGYGFGYLGGGLLFAINVAMTLAPARFGLRDAAQAVRVSFVMVAVWWAIFSVPLLRWVPEPASPVESSSTPSARDDPSRGFGVGAAARSALGELWQTLQSVRQQRAVWLFLLGYWLYIDGVDTIIRMAVDYGLSLGFSSQALITALLITQFVGFPAALAYGYLGQRIGAKRGILFGLLIYVAVTVFGYYMDSEPEFYILAVVVGLVQGGVQALSRSFYSRLIPAEKSAEFFGFYNMLGKFAAVIGPTLMGAVGKLTGSHRVAILSIALLLIGGAWLLLRVPDGDAPAATELG